MVEKSLIGSQEENKRRNVTREEFGEGPAGDYAFHIVSTSDKCEAIDPNSNKQCKNYAVQTLDFDVIGQMEVAPNCSDECAKLLQIRIRGDLAKHNMTTAFGKNGWGRERA